MLRQVTKSTARPNGIAKTIAKMTFQKPNARRPSVVVWATSQFAGPT